MPARPARWGTEMAAPATAPNLSRRGFLTGAKPQAFRPAPPGVTAISVARCTGCGDCVSACPQDILRIIEGRAAIDFGNGHECTFCNACADACPEPIFTERPVMAHVLTITDTCLARRGTTCMSCRDACPESAIRMMPRIGGPFLPELDAAACTGCGACLAPCPVDAIALTPKEPADEYA